MIDISTILTRLSEYFSLKYVFEPSMMVQNIVTCICVLIILEQGKKKAGRIAAHFLMLLGSLSIMNGIWHIVIHQPGMYFVSHLLLLLMFAFMVRSGSSKATLVACALFYSIEMCLIIFSSTFAHIFTVAGDPIEIILRNMSVVGTLFAALLFRFFSIRDFNELPGACVTYSVMITVVTTSLAVLYNTIGSEIEGTGSIFALACFGGILIINAVTYYLAYSVCLFNDEERRLQAESLMRENDQQMIQLNQQNLEEMRRIRHDIRNQFGYMQILLDNKNYDELHAYFGKMRAQIAVPLSSIDCGNRNISAILNLEAAKAASMKISFDHRIMIPRELPFSDIDMCCLLTNLLDNALEACESQKVKDPAVEIGMRTEGSMLYISVLNSIDGTRKKEGLLSLKTTKKNKKIHGYGTQIVDGIVRKYNGQLNRTVEGERYIVDVMLDLYAGEDTK